MLQDQYYTTWINTLKPSTQRTYSVGLSHFCEFTGLTPKELVDEAYADYESFVPPYKLRHIKYIDAWQIHLKNDASFSNNTKLSYITAVKSFYGVNKISTSDVNKPGISNTVTEKYLELPVLKLEHVRKMVQYFSRNEMLKALILTVFSSGQAQDDIYNLRGRHLKERKNGVAIVKNIRGKTQKNPYLFFISAEALQAIEEYKPYIRDDEFVFTMQNGNKLEVNYIGQYLSRLEIVMGWQQGYARLHRVRHYWESVLTGRMNETYLEYIIGHKVAGAKSSYFKGEGVQDDLLTAYMENLSLLTVFTNPEKLQTENDLLKAKQDGEIEEIKKNNKMLQEQMDVLNEFLGKFGHEGLKMIDGVGES